MEKAQLGSAKRLRRSAWFAHNLHARNESQVARQVRSYISKARKALISMRWDVSPLAIGHETAPRGFLRKIHQLGAVDHWSTVSTQTSGWAHCASTVRDNSDSE